MIVCELMQHIRAPGLGCGSHAATMRHLFIHTQCCNPQTLPRREEAKLRLRSVTQSGAGGCRKLLLTESRLPGWILTCCV